MIMAFSRSLCGTAALLQAAFFVSAHTASSPQAVAGSTLLSSNSHSGLASANSSAVALAARSWTDID